MGLKELVMVNAIVSFLDSDDVARAVEQAAVVADAFLDEKLKHGSEKTQDRAVKTVLLPFSRILMRENKEAYRKVLQDELALLG